MSPSRVVEDQSAHLQTSFDFPAEANTVEYARLLDSKDPIRHLRSQFIIPSKANLKTKKLTKVDESPSSERCIYFCGNSLGLQPRPTAKYLEAHLDTWSTLAVHGHFTDLEDSPLRQWQLMAEQASAQQATIVGALPTEIATMGSLTSNLHTLLASFYRPTATRHKIIMDWKAFPSDHYTIESQISWNGQSPKDSMILISPDAPSYTIPTTKILSLIDEHASTTALLLLPGIQYYSGQFFDMEAITKHAQEKGIVVGWDLAHAAGNVPLQLHDWNVDFAAWCTYKYMNAGPGAISGLFIHERHGLVDYSQGEDSPVFRPRLTGWYGHDTGSRFKMDNKFKPTPGASGYQLSNPSIVDITTLLSSLSIFSSIPNNPMSTLRQKSFLLTAYLQYLLLLPPPNKTTSTSTPPTALPYKIITPLQPTARGAQLSILLAPGLLPTVDAALRSAGIVADKRQPDVVRVAPVPLYNTFEEVWGFVRVFRGAVGLE